MGIWSQEVTLARRFRPFRGVVPNHQLLKGPNKKSQKEGAKFDQKYQSLGSFFALDILK